MTIKASKNIDKHYLNKTVRQLMFGLYMQID